MNRESNPNLLPATLVVHSGKRASRDPGSAASESRNASTVADRFAVGSVIDGVAVLLEAADYERGDLRIIFDDKNAHGIGSVRRWRQGARG